ncbi:MAG: hypothetical protein OXN16_10845 [Gammaproteobacteria bacterium]|nr:hypothetical protein [Gammaproteobacteria bacterium]
MNDLNNKVTVWWIDDDHADESGTRESERNAMGNALVSQAGKDLDLIPIHPVDFEDYALNLPDKRPDLLLIDFRLGYKEKGDRKTPYFARDGVRLRGTTLGDNILKDVPAYLVSGVIQESQNGTSDDQFDWVLSYQQLTDELGGKFLLDDARDYRRLQDIHDKTPKNIDTKEIQKHLVEGILDLLQVPPDSIESVENIVRHTVANLLQSESKHDSNELQLSPSRPRAIARWIRAAMLNFRGPLIDERSAANMLGANLIYFNKIKEFDIESARYRGIFNRTASMTLWKQTFLKILLSKDESIIFPSLKILAKSASDHFSIPENELAVCRVCGEFWPEAIAFDEDDPAVDAAVHWRCSKEVTNVDSLFGFEILRSFRK